MTPATGHTHGPHGGLVELDEGGGVHDVEQRDGAAEPRHGLCQCDRRELLVRRGFADHGQLGDVVLVLLGDAELEAAQPERFGDALAHDLSVVAALELLDELRGDPVRGERVVHEDRAWLGRGEPAAERGPTLVA